MEASLSKQLVIRNDVSELNRVQAFTEELEALGMFPASFSMQLNLVLEEALSNIIFYAYQQGSSHTIQVDFVALDKSLEVTITDSGKAFDPTAKEDPDINLPAQERPIGGLGIFLIKKIMDELSYTRKQEYNILKMKKNFD